MTRAEAIDFLESCSEMPPSWPGWEEHRQAASLLRTHEAELLALVKEWTDQVERLRLRGGRAHVADAIAACAEEIQTLVQKGSYRS